MSWLSVIKFRLASNSFRVILTPINFIYAESNTLV